MLAWTRGGEGEMTAERRATHTHAGAVGAVFVYSIRTCAEFNCACVLLRARAICYVHSVIINFIPGILEAKNMIQKYKGDTKYTYPHV